MPWTTTWHDDGAELNYSGITTGSEILQAKREFLAHAFARPPRYALCDFSNVDRFDVTPQDVQFIISQDERALVTHPHLMEAVIAPSPIQFGMSRMWEMHMDHTARKAIVTRTREEALGWLNEQGVSLARV